MGAIAETSKELKQQCPAVFSGVGKLNTKQVSLHIDPNMTPVAQPLRRSPFNLRERLESNIESLLALDIIVPVKGALYRIWCGAN